MVQTDTDQRMSLDLNLYSLAKPLSQFLNDVSKIKDNHSKLFEIDEYVGKLEEERKKIDVFKRELPLCMLLMNEAIERLKEEASSVKLEIDNKKNWMNSTQLWISKTNPQLPSTNGEEDRCVTQTCSNNNNSNQGGAILSFNVPPRPPPLSLRTPILTDYSSRIEQSHPIQKKELRRRWSEDLHRRFVDALQMIGGSQVATPKQIKDIMKVDGLTNDEIKSHLQCEMINLLQKYRMHIHKHPAKILTASDQHGLSRSDSPQGPLVDRGLFSNNGHSSEEEEKSDGRSWKSESRRKRQGLLDLEL
ncbi:transcription factor HHO5 isoform X1 [Brassica rapa]|nr:transcription factor HHO5 isoform X1 [Brassica rapa]